MRAGRWCLSTAAYEYYYCQKVQVKPAAKATAPPAAAPKSAVNSKVEF